MPLSLSLCEFQQLCARITVCCARFAKLPHRCVYVIGMSEFNLRLEKRAKIHLKPYVSTVIAEILNILFLLCMRL